MPMPPDAAAWAANYLGDHPPENLHTAMFGEPSSYIALRKGQSGVLHDDTMRSMANLKELIRQLPQPHRAAFFDTLSVEGVELPSLRNALKSEMEKLHGICRGAVALQAHLVPIINGSWDANALHENLVKSLESEMLKQAGRVI